MTPPENTLCYGNCLDWMARWDDAPVDLIYLAPPFNSNANYNLLYSRDSAGGAQTRAFADTWSWDAAAGERLARFEGATGGREVIQRRRGDEPGGLRAAIIVYWNTLKLGEAVFARRKADITVPADCLAHVSPLGWEYINLTGEYLWPGTNSRRATRKRLA